jgi:hypothetical protein
MPSNEMIFLFLSLFCFLSLMLTHLLGLRFRLFTAKPTALCFLAVGGLALYSGLIFIAARWTRLEAQTHALFGARWPWSSGLLYVLLCFVYFAEFTLVLHESPSLKILRHIRSHAEGETTERDLKKMFTDDNLIPARLQDLAESGYVSFDGSRYALLPNGMRIVGLIRAYREFLRLGIGG